MIQLISYRRNHSRCLLYFEINDTKDNQIDYRCLKSVRQKKMNEWWTRLEIRFDLNRIEFFNVLDIEPIAADAKAKLRAKTTILGTVVRRSCDDEIWREVSHLAQMCCPKLLQEKHLMIITSRIKKQTNKQA